MDDDGLGCCCGCCLLCCACAAEVICNWCTFLVALAAAAVLVAAFGVALPVRATVTDASLSRLDLVVTNSNGTATATAASSVSVSVAYNLSLTVQLRNRNWAMRVELAAPLDAELRFAGRRFDGARLADPGRSVPPRGTEEFRVLAASPSPGGAALGGAGAAAELSRERAEGVFEVELRIAGEVRYRPVHAGRRSRLEATCPLKLLMPNAPRGTHLVVLQKDVSCY
ncbi:NDR1/HIN1-like protein 10 [Miscanthus floridulus]|uniref:NDR1/HIN1-like protein 10 n=1 Tax=Miscanthus floridulus TaxID=154761 RepID=UPI003458E502